MKTLLLCVVGLVCASAFAADKPKEYFDPEVQKLIAVQAFGFGPTSFEHTRLPGEEAFGAILRKPGAVRYMVAVFDYGTTEARCYALVALREFSDALYDRCETAFRKDPPVKVTTVEKSTVKDEHPSKVLAAIERGVYRKYFTQYDEAR